MVADRANVQLRSAVDALELCRQAGSSESLGASALPLLVVDLRGLERSFRKDEQDDELARLLIASTWVNVAIVDDELDPVFAPLADAFDVLIGDGTQSAAAVDSDDVASTLGEIASAIQASPQASVELVRLLRASHDRPVEQALHAESLTYAVLQSGTAFQHWLAARTSKPVDNVEQVVTMQLEGSLLRVTLQRPAKRNALNVAMRDQLAEAFMLVDLDDSIDGMILTGAGDNFCAGGDLDEFGTTPSPAVGHQVRMARSLPAMMHRIAARARVHVHGACVGAGIELPAFASSVIAHPDSTFRLPEIVFGLVPGAGGTVSITRRCGRHRTAWLALTGTTIDAQHALRWQIIDRIDPALF